VGGFLLCMDRRVEKKKGGGLSLLKYLSGEMRVHTLLRERI